MSTELLKGTLNIIILLVISKGPTYGYEISKTIEDLSNKQLLIKDSSLYTILLRLEQLNYIESNFKVSEKYPRRKYYQTTTEGRKYMDSNIKKYEIINALINKLV